MRTLSDYTLEEFQRELAAWGFKPSHAARVLRAHYALGPDQPVTGRAIPRPLAARLAGVPPGPGEHPAVRHVAADGTR